MLASLDDPEGVLSVPSIWLGGAHSLCVLCLVLYVTVLVDF